MSETCRAHPPAAADKGEALLAILRGLESAAVALSGGVDSAVVAKAAFLALGSRAVAVTGDSPSVPRAEIEQARRLAAEIGIRHRILATQEFHDPNYVRNDGARCYHCKTELYSQIERLLPELGVSCICSGANLDDAGDYRPGLTAAAEHRVRHPLQEAGFRKQEVRDLARHWGLMVHDKPASPCLSSRIAPGVAATPERAGRIEAAEAFLKGWFGLRDLRVRLHEGELARIEVPAAEIPRLAEPLAAGEIAACLRKLGFRFVTLDLEGLRSGNLNDLVPLEIKRQFHPEDGDAIRP